MSLNEFHTFHWVQGQVTYLASQRAVAQYTSPSRAHPPYWGPLTDTPDGRKELGKRIRALFALTGSDLHGEERVFHIKEWIEREKIQ